MNTVLKSIAQTLLVIAASLAIAVLTFPFISSCTAAQKQEVKTGVDFLCGTIQEYADAQWAVCELLPEYEDVYRCRKSLELGCKVMQELLERGIDKPVEKNEQLAL